MSNRSEFELKLRDYPDVVTVKELAIMLGGITVRTTLSLIKKGEIKCFRIGNQYRIPKPNIIDFMMSREYELLISRSKRIYALNEREKEEQKKQKLLFLCETPQTRKDLMFLLDVKSKKVFFRVYLRPLLESGQLQMTHPEQPSISTQRYIRSSLSKAKY